MRVRLIDIDSRIPNLALMQISAHHKAQGDEVGFDVNDPDRIYVSCIFSRNAGIARGAATLYPGTEAVFGGSGLSNDWLPLQMQRVRPDYDLYPSRYSLGFTTRGCVRHCPFCIVPAKEGRLRRWQHPREFHDDRFNTIALLDNNLLADRPWFFEVTDWLLDHRLKVDFMQGLDVRLLDREIAEQLKTMRWAGNIRFAWDNLADEPAVMRGIGLLRDVGLNLKHDVGFFVLVGFNSTFPEDQYRCERLKQEGVNAFVMKYRASPELNALARWANRRQLYWSIDFDEYSRRAVT